MPTHKEQVFDICNALAGSGWQDLIKSATTDSNSPLAPLDIMQSTAADLEAELLRPRAVDRNFPGFEDFSLEGNQGITPRFPARSIFYHAFASPKVIFRDSARTQKLTAFPTFEQLEIVENYVFGVRPPSLGFLGTLFPGAEMSVVVFANQYRTAIDVPHQKHADLVFSRTGIARVGTDDLVYNEETRSFDPLVESDAKKIRVLPAKYNAYIAVKLKGSVALLGSRRFRDDASRDVISDIPTDDQLDFFYPIHKLFDGDECLDGKPVQLGFSSKHVNEKIRKIHNFIQTRFSLDSGQSPGSLNDFPFRYSDGIATFDAAQHLMVPTVHSSLVLAAEVNNKALSVLKPKFGTFNEGSRVKSGIRTSNNETISHIFSSMEMRSPNRGREVPEYLHIRERTSPSATDLNTTSTMMDTILTGNEYGAQHYVDFTGDGWVDVDINVTIGDGTTVPAHSLIAAVDLFPFCEQTEILDNPNNAGLWSTAPLSLADTRFGPNMMTHPEFKTTPVKKWDTVTALVPHVIDANLQQTQFADRIERRVTYLPDGANGIFAPGWDTSFDTNVIDNEAVQHLSNYGLGSPFPEDAKLCAALSSFWPAVAPDITRSFWPSLSPTIVPLLDEEIGANGQGTSWDGEPGPEIDRSGDPIRVRYKRIEYVDYTTAALNNQFDYHILASIDAIEYQSRLQKLAKAQPSVSTWSNSLLISYRQVDASDSDVQNVMARDNVQLVGTIHKFLFMEATAANSVPNKFQFVDIEIGRELMVFVDEAETVHEV